MASALRCSAILAATSIAAASLHHTSTSHQDRLFIAAIPPSPSIGSLGAGLVGSFRETSGAGGWLNKQPLRLAERFAMTMDAVRAGSPSRMVRADATTAEASTEAAPELVTEFMVEMMCEGCATSVRNKLQTLPGVNDVKTNVTDQTVRITGTESLKSLLKALEETGRSTRLIGQGSLEEFEISAAVAEFKGPVLMGVLRIAQVTKDTARVEGQFDGLTPGPHAVFLNQYGDLTRGAASTGGIYTDEGREAGFLGVAQADESGHAELSTATVPLRVYDLIGRALVVSRDEKVSTENAFAAVVARSAGVGQNLKSLCSCDGTVIWEAQQDRIK